MTKLPARYGRIKPKSESSDVEQTSRMITLVSHELKNPLSAIQLTAEMLSKYRDRFSVADQEKHLQNLLSNTQLLKELIDRTGNYCRLYFDIVHPVLQSVDLNEFMRNATIEASEWADCNHPIQFLPNAVTIHVKMDVFQMKTVLENILKNSMHFSQPGCPIYLCWKQLDNRVEISITDQGTGIPDSDRKQVFDPFFRTRDLAGKTGTGLGLTICRQIVDKHEGEIRISNNRPKGTTVRILLPYTI